MIQEPVLLVTLVSVAGALIAYLLRRFVFYAVHPSEGTLATVSTLRIFAIFAIAFPMGVTIQEALGDYLDAERATRYEAQSVATLWREAGVKPVDPDLQAVQQAAHCYLKYVVGVEWPLMSAGRVDQISDDRLWGLYKSIPRDETLTHARAFAVLEDIAIFRATRIHAARISTPKTLVHFLVLASLVLVVAAFIEGMAARAVVQAAVVGGVLGLAGALFAILYCLDTTFSPPIAVSPVDLAEKLQLLVRIAAPGALKDCGTVSAVRDI